MRTMDRLLLLVIAGVLAGTYYFTNSHVPSPVEQKSVSVVGVGEASATPDQLTITFSIAQTGATTQAAQELVSKQIDQLRKGLTDLGITEQLKTESFTTSPDYFWKDGDRELRGQKTVALFSIKLEGEDFQKKWNQVLQFLPHVGDVEISSTYYTLSSQETPKLKAREKAFETAKAQAEQMAKLLWKKLGKVLSISAENSSYDGPMPYYANAVMKESAVAATSLNADSELISAGEEKITASLNVTFELK